MKRAGRAYEVKLQIIAACSELITAEDIAERIGLSVVTIRNYLNEMKDVVARFTEEKPWVYVAQPDDQTADKLKELRRKQHETEADLTMPILPSGPLSFLSECERYIPPQGRKVKEKHATWIDRKSVPHIGCGSQAHVELIG